MIVEQYDGIHPPFEAFYIQSIIYAANRSDAAFEAFDQATAERMPSDLVFAMIQEALTHAGALSRFFWPVRKDDPLAVARGAKLRKAFNLNDMSPLRSRALRMRLSISMRISIAFCFGISLDISSRVHWSRIKA